jgi:protein subunit release factor B
MYTCWARRQGCKEGLVEKIASTSGHVQFAAMEIESEYMFGILSGEQGMHRMINSSIDNFGTEEVITLSYPICHKSLHCFSVQAIKHNGYIT